MLEQMKCLLIYFGILEQDRETNCIDFTKMTEQELKQMLRRMKNQ